MVDNSTPDKYLPDDTKKFWEKKDWLYERYWGEMKTQRELAEEADVPKRYICDVMDELGVRTRIGCYNRQNNVSPFRGFYAEDTPTQGNHEVGDAQDAWERRTEHQSLTWQKAYEIEGHTPTPSNRENKWRAED